MFLGLGAAGFPVIAGLALRPAGPVSARDLALALPIVYLVHQFEEHGVDTRGRRHAFMASANAFLGPAVGCAPGTPCPLGSEAIYWANTMLVWWPLALAVVFAREKIDQIAEARGLTADELADRLVPDLGLDERGTRVLDFGPRSFRVVFDESLKPAVLDETKKRLPDLPKPKQTDDAEKAKEATDTWKALKKDAKVLAAGQLLRLEVAMCAQRRWAMPVFQRFLVDHPLLAHVVRRLL